MTPFVLFWPLAAGVVAWLIPVPALVNERCERCDLFHGMESCEVAQGLCGETDNGVRCDRTAGHHGDCCGSSGPNNTRIWTRQTNEGAE